MRNKTPNRKRNAISKSVYYVCVTTTFYNGFA